MSACEVGECNSVRYLSGNLELKMIDLLLEKVQYNSTKGGNDYL